MSESEEGLESTEDSENEFGVILGYWDYEKTPNLIQDLEQSVTLAELKCKNLLEELTDYKKFLEKPEETEFHLAVFKKNNKKSNNSVLFSGSEPEIAFRKNLIHFEKIKRVFEEKFEEKLKNVNKDIENAAHKIGLKGSIILYSVNDYLRICDQPELTEKYDRDGQTKEDKKIDEEDIREKFIKLSTLETKTKSDSLIVEYGEDLDFSKITKNQLELYQKLSRLSKKKTYAKKLVTNRKTAKFFLNRKTRKYRQRLRMFRDRSKRPKSGKKGLKKIKNKRAKALKNKSSLLHHSDSSRQPRDLKPRQASFLASIEDANKSREEVKEREKEVETSLGAVLRKVMPFTVCTSISRSHNIGLNMQQLLYLSKHRRKSGLRGSSSEKIHEDGKKENIESMNLKQDVINVKKMPSTPWNHFQTKNNNSVNGEQRGSACVTGYVTSFNYKKVRPKTAERSPNGVIKYRKSTTSQFTTGQKSMIQSKSKTAYAIGSKIMVSDCQRTLEIEKGNSFNNASGDGKGKSNKCVDLYTEWGKVYSSFLKIYRKYIYLKEKVSSTKLDYTNEDLKSLEKDIDNSIATYKEFLKFYTEFLHLNHRLKSLKIACETKTFEPGASSFSSNCQTKIWGNKAQTHSITMKNAFREIQALKNKINLVSD